MLQKGCARTLLLLGLLLTFAAGIGEAQTYSTVPFTYNSVLTYYSVPWPTGSVTFGGIPFSIPASSYNLWAADSASGPNPRTLEIPVYRYGTTRVYTLINTIWGQSGSAYASLEFFGDNGGYYKKYLYGNADIRDYNQSTWTNSINGTTTVNVFSSTPAGRRLDMQKIDLPSSFADQTLVKITLSDWGETNFQRVFLYGVTVLGRYSVSGVMGHLASGGTWTTAITLMNHGSAPATARLRFFDDNGRALVLPFTFSAGAPERTAQFDRTVQPGASLVAETTGPDEQAVAVGSMRLDATGNISGFAIFRQKIGDAEQEAVVPLGSRNPGSFVLWFDNTSSYVTGVAVANAVPQVTSFTAVVRDDTGRALGTTGLSLLADGHISFALPTQWPITAGIRGTIEFLPRSSGQIGILGLRFNRSGAFTTIPAVQH